MTQLWALHFLLMVKYNEQIPTPGKRGSSFTSSETRLLLLSVEDLSEYGFVS